MKRTFTYCFILSFCMSFVHAQDIHYSQFFNTPLNISPGLAGNFNGNQRVGINVRQQWQTVPVDYKSFDAFYEIKTSNSRKQNHFNFGLLLNYDDTGDIGLVHNGVRAVVGYAIRLSDKWFANPGLGVGFVQRRYDSSRATTGNQWNGRRFTPSIPAEFVGSERLDYINLNAGLSFRYWKGERTFIDLGGSVFNINGVDQSFNTVQTSLANLERRYNAFAMLNLRAGGKTDVVLNAIYQIQTPHQEVVLNGQLKIYLDKYFSKAIFLGAGLRLEDAWYPMIALQLGDVYAAFSYDINFSDFTIATNGRGGPELSMQYKFSKVGEFPKKPCPIY